MSPQSIEGPPLFSVDIELILEISVIVFRSSDNNIDIVISIL